MALLVFLLEVQNHGASTLPDRFGAPADQPIRHHARQRLVGHDLQQAIPEILGSELPANVLFAQIRNPRLHFAALPDVHDPGCIRVYIHNQETDRIAQNLITALATRIVRLQFLLNYLFFVFDRAGVILEGLLG